MLQRHENSSVLTMATSEWRSAVSVPNRYIELDIAITPMSELASKATLLATVAIRHSSGTGQVEIYRNDPRDAPCNVNADFFTVVENIEQHPRFDRIVSEASTEMNNNLRNYIRNTIFLIPQPKDERHWSTGLPAHVTAIMGPRPSSSTS